MRTGDKENLAWAANGAQPQSAAASQQQDAALQKAEQWTDSGVSGSDKWSGVRHYLGERPLSPHAHLTSPGCKAECNPDLYPNPYPNPITTPTLHRSITRRHGLGYRKLWTCQTRQTR